MAAQLRAGHFRSHLLRGRMLKKARTWALRSPAVSTPCA